ncbi:MAG: HAD family hydrolase [Actinomycetota bacterium]|nr:HAD family hydrolase [Actinomycetota bacterium]
MSRALEAVLFDWGDTLMAYDEVATDEFAVTRTRAGLAAIRREALPEPAAIGRWFAELGTERFREDPEDEVDYLGLLAACFADLGCELTDDDVRLYAREALWEAEMAVEPDALVLLEALRSRSLKLAIVSNTALPEWLLGPVFARQGLAERVDAIVLSSEVGKRKPHRAIFERALAKVGARPERSLFVGDRRVQDVLGARRLGMRTVLARWFRRDVNPDGAEPDFTADGFGEVVAIVDRLDARP